MEENKEQETVVMKGSNNKGLITALILIILLLAGGLIYMVFFYKENKEPVNNNNIEEKEQKTNNETSKEETKEENKEENKEDNEEKEEKKEKQYDLDVYYYSTYDTLCVDYDSDTCRRKAFTIKTYTENAKILATDSDTQNLFLLYSDDGTYIYNVKTKESKKISLKNNYKEYDVEVSDDKTKALGIYYLKNDKEVGYYSIAKDKEMFNFQKSEYGSGFRSIIYKLNDTYSTLSLYGKGAYLLNTNTGKVDLKYETKADEGEYRFGTLKGKKKYIIILDSGFDYSEYKKLYTSNLKQFYDSGNNSSIPDYNVGIKDDNIYIMENNSIKKYDFDGNLVITKNNYGTIKSVVNNYVVYVKNNNLILENIDSDTESKVLTKWDNSWSLDVYGTGYYDRNTLDRMDEKNKKEGLYVVIDHDYDGNGHIIKDANGNYGMEYCYTSDKQIIEYPIKQEKGGRAKPVLYLYPTKETNVTVKFSNPNVLTTTYPKYINSWNVTVKPNGDMTDKDGKYYYALYWDEKRYHEVDFSEGFYVEGKDAISFLEEKLKYIGLNDKERNEFIMYWLPIMEANKKNLVYFELTKEREASNKLIISPKPDSLLRVSIHIKKVNSKTTIKEQKLETFKRVGFTAVEWGGMTY